MWVSSEGCMICGWMVYVHDRRQQHTSRKWLDCMLYSLLTFLKNLQPESSFSNC